MEKINLILNPYGIEIHCQNCENIFKNSLNRKKKIQKQKKKINNIKNSNTKMKNSQKPYSFEKENYSIFLNNNNFVPKKMNISPLNEKIGSNEFNINKLNKIKMKNIFIKTPQKKKKFLSDFELSDYTPIKEKKKIDKNKKNLLFNYSTANKCNFDIFDDRKKDDFFEDIEKINGFNYMEENEKKEGFELKKILNFEKISQSQDSLKKDFSDF